MVQANKLNGSNDLSSIDLDRLSRRQMEIARHYADGLTYKRIAETLSISPATVRNHVSAIYRELGIGNKIELAKLFHALSSEHPSSQTQSATSSSPENRQVTMLLCSYGAGTAHSTEPDTRTFKDLLSSVKSVVENQVVEFGGTILEQFDNESLALFGYPITYEDTPERAIRAAQKIQDQYQERVKTSKNQIDVSIALNTTTVLISGPPQRDVEHFLPKQIIDEHMTSLLDMIVLSSRDNAVLITEQTRRLTGSLFDYEHIHGDPEDHSSRSISFWNVLPSAVKESRFSNRMARLAPMTGRHAELYLLKERWAQAQEGFGQVVVLTGGAGIGKSRIVYEFNAERGETEDDCFLYQCSSYHINTAFHPFLDYLRNLLVPDDEHQSSLDRLTALLDDYNESSELSRSVLGSLLSVDTQNNRIPQLSPDKRRQETLALLERIVLFAAKQGPQLIVIEDIHWMDPSSSELVAQLIREAQNRSILLVLTTRPEGDFKWPDYGHVTSFTLTKLTRNQVRDLINDIVHKAPEPTIREQIVDHSDGIPLFVEEITRALVDNASTSEVEVSSGLNRQLLVPATLQDALLARLNDVPQARQIAQLGACIGRDFSYKLLEAISPLDDAQLNECLKQLVMAEILFRRGQGDASSFSFKHALLRDVCRQNLPKPQQRELHARIAIHLENTSGGFSDQQPELIAFHLTEAGLSQKAIFYWRRAGENSISNSNNLEAIDQLTTAIELLQSIPETARRDRLELELRLSLGVAQQAVLGYASLQVQQNYAKAQELCEELTDTHERVPVLRGLYIFHLMRGDLTTAHQIAKQLVDLASANREEAQLLEANFAIGQTHLFFSNDFEASEAHFSSAMSQYDTKRHGQHAYRFGQDPGVYCLQLWAFQLQLQGNLQQAEQKSKQARKIAAQIDHPLTLSSANVFAAQLYQWRNEPELVLQYATESNKISKIHLLPYFSGWSQLLSEWARTKLYQESDWNAMNKSLQMFADTGTGLGYTICCAVYADALVFTGRLDDALEIIESALQHADRWHEPYIVPELLRLRGLSEYHLGQTTKSLSTLVESENLAQEGGMRYWRLRSILERAQLTFDSPEQQQVRSALHDCLKGFVDETCCPVLTAARAICKYSA